MGINLNNITKRFGTLCAIKNLNLDLPETGIITLFGPSGCGKTTLLRLIAGLETPDEGVIEGVGAHKISMVFQEDRLIPWISARDNIRLPLRPDAAEKKTSHWLKVMGLEEMGDKLPGQLSGGMRRRVALARAAAFEGSLLVMDEPFKELDDALIHHIANTILKGEAAPSLILLVTHSRREALLYSDQVLLFDGPPLRFRKRIAINPTYRERLENPSCLESYNACFDVV